MERFDGGVLAYRLMDNHYHRVLQTRRANLSRLLRHINGVYAQAFNRRHGLVGHVFQGRFQVSFGSAQERRQAVRRAYAEDGMTMTAIAKAVGLSVSQVSRLISRAEGLSAEMPPLRRRRSGSRAAPIPEKLDVHAESVACKT